MTLPNRSTALSQPASSAAATVDPVSREVPFDRRTQELAVLVVERVQVDHLGVHPHRIEVEHVGDAAGHARAEVAAGRAQHDDPATRHVFAAVVADTLHDRGRAGVAHGEPLPHHPAEERLAARRAVQQHVARDDVVLGGEGRALRRLYDDATTGQALADVVVGVA